MHDRYEKDHHNPPLVNPDYVSPVASGVHFAKPAGASSQQPDAVKRSAGHYGRGARRTSQGQVIYCGIEIEGSTHRSATGLAEADFKRRDGSAWLSER